MKSLIVLLFVAYVSAKSNEECVQDMMKIGGCAMKDAAKPDKTKIEQLMGAKDKAEQCIKDSGCNIPLPPPIGDLVNCLNGAAPGFFKCVVDKTKLDVSKLVPPAPADRQGAPPAGVPSGPGAMLLKLLAPQGMEMLDKFQAADVEQVKKFLADSVCSKAADPAAAANKLVTCVKAQIDIAKPLLDEMTSSHCDAGKKCFEDNNGKDTLKDCRTNFGELKNTTCVCQNEEIVSFVMKNKDGVCKTTVQFFSQIMGHGPQQQRTRRFAPQADGKLQIGFCGNLFGQIGAMCKDAPKQQ